MGKVKNKLKKKRLSEVTKTPIKKKSLNPFEVHVNRQKHNVIGRKLKTDKGLPGVSRSKAMKKRKATLLQEYKVKDKSNKFFDRRIGEKNNAMTAEDRITARFTAQKMKMHNKKTMYNLADDEYLTHHGQTLNEIEKFDDPRSDDDEDDKGKLESNFVEDAHFGGGVLKKADDNSKMSRKDLIEQLIAESKKRKAEKQQARDQTVQLTEKLDSEWKDLLPIVSAVKKQLGKDTEDVTKPDSYDTVMQELKFEARGKPTDRLKSEDELAQLEKERIEKLEAERQKRMCGFLDEPTFAYKHRSADDLDDGFKLDSNTEVGVSYDSEGRLLAQENLNEKGADLEENEKAVSETNSGKEESDEEQGGDDGNDDNEDVEEESVEEEDDDGGGDKKEDVEEESVEEEDNLSDLKKISDSESEVELPEDNEGQLCKADVIQEVDGGNNTRDCKQKLSDQERKNFIEVAKKKFPNICKVPDKYEDLHTILTSYTTEQQAAVIENVVKCNHPGLGEGNRSKLDTLFTYLLQYLHESQGSSSKCGKTPHCFAVLDYLAPYMYDLAQFSPENARRCVIEVLKEKQLEFRKHNRKYPRPDTLVFLKLISLLFPTSDFRHPVVTPAVVFMCQMLLQCRVRTKRDVGTGLFLVTLMLEYTVLSKRFSPAAINFLRGVVYMAIHRTKDDSLGTIPPFKARGGASSLLVLNDKESIQPSQHLLLSDLSDDVPIDNGFRIRALYAALAMLNEFQSNLYPLLASYEIFKPILALLKRLESDDRYPIIVKDQLLSLTKAIDNMSQRKIQLLVVEKKKAKALRLYEPNIETVYDCKRRRPMGKEKQEHEKLLHRYKREQKAVVREIRRDNTFIAKLKLRQTIKSDLARKEKVKEIFGDAANQQGELRNLKRKKH